MYSNSLKIKPMVAEFNMKSQNKVVVYYIENDDKTVTEDMIEQYEKAREENKPFYLGQFSTITRLYINGKPKKMFDWCVDTTQVETWYIGV